MRLADEFLEAHLVRASDKTYVETLAEADYLWMWCPGPNCMRKGSHRLQVWIADKIPEIQQFPGRADITRDVRPIRPFAGTTLADLTIGGEPFELPGDCNSGTLTTVIDGEVTAVPRMPIL